MSAAALRRISKTFGKAVPQEARALAAKVQGEIAGELKHGGDATPMRVYLSAALSKLCITPAVALKSPGWRAP
ncbi:hypothetical protein GCM10027034_31640 [Ramlibacter solisilvae]|uniref:Uncharacterized protein n=1 Tax=Ramlibacter tataouinensis TaxID=94132 RepID=A0A127JRV0_9BURK|nr:hypothetical protein [Ramlibacter tataouinensis]AMO22700.1 hypothetical protein UC35_07180 [Ramlibacter tataouinensis]